MTDLNSSASISGERPRQLVWFAWLAAILTLAFALPLFGMVRYALSTELHSHAPLIPFIAAYLVWLGRHHPLPRPSGSPALAVVPFVVAVMALKPVLFPATAAAPLKPNDFFALTTFSYLCFLWAGGLLVLGFGFLRSFLFPAGFLIFMVPLPTVVENALEVFFQHSSAHAAHLLFALTGMSFFRDGLFFELPGITLQVAQECSGIRSSLVLFITSLLAAQMFLQSPVRRAVIVLFVIPLAIVRNAFRIVTIGWLCVKISPDMIESWIHHRGGPLFFALSLVPFFLLLFWLRRGELRRRAAAPPA